MRGKKWEPEWDAVLEARYADELNAVLAKELGCGERTVVRHARRLGLEKSPEFMRRARENAVAESKRWYEYMRITGQKVGNHGAPGRKFQKGHRFEGEIEARRIQAIRDRAWDERVRIIRGVARKTGWPMVDYCARKVK